MEGYNLISQKETITKSRGDRMLYAVTHSHGYEDCPAQSMETLKRFNEMISDERARKAGIRVVDRYVDEDCTTVGKSKHFAYFLAEADSREAVEEFFGFLGVTIRPVVAWSQVQRTMKL